MKESTCIAFTGGGSGGHVFPGIAIIEELQEKKHANIVWIGSRFGPEKKMVGDRSIPYHAISTGKFRRYFSYKNVTDLFRIARGFFQARKILKKKAVACLVSLGGFVSVPVAFAAWSLRIPVLSLVLDVSLSLSSRLSTKISSVVFFSYEETMRLPTGSGQKIHSAYPVRKEIRNADPKRCVKQFDIDPKSRVLFCMGGSLGAEQINELVASMCATFSSDVVLVHQTGAKKHHVPDTGLKARYIQGDFFTDNYASLLSRADLVLGRAGAGMIWECVEQSVPMVLIPLSTKASRGDQGENARYFSERGMAKDMGDEPDAATLLHAVQDLLTDPEARGLFRSACKRFRSEKIAARTIADHIVSF